MRRLIIWGESTNSNVAGSTETMAFLSATYLGRHAYVTVVITAGAFVIGDALISLIEDPIGSDWFRLAALTLLTGSFSINPFVNARISVLRSFRFRRSAGVWRECGGHHSYF